ncbi:WXG100 family type VII secretion target [Micromonospora sp. NBC_00617]|uniref:WXG100 family type VII secretion target n=1 Tax=Micromonospora sp. NBC_00617 TaxID=2903587 RepID=UPI0030E1D999
MGLSWEEMCQKVVIDGRPGDVESAALGWEQLIKNLNNVKQSLDTNIKDLGTTWKGPAYEAFKGHIEQISKDTGQIVADAEKGTGIVQSLKTAADKLTAAQREFPIPATCVNDVLEARNAKLTLGVGFFEAKVSPDFLGWLDPVTAIADWINDQSEDAARVYQQVSGDYQAIAPGTPGDATGTTRQEPTSQIPKLDNGGGGGGGGGGGVPKLGDGLSAGDLGAKPSIGTTGMPDTGNLPSGSSAHPDLSGGYDPGAGNYPSTGSVPGVGGADDEFSSGLAGAGGGGSPGLGSGLGGGGLGSGGLGSSGGLGGGGGGGLGSAGALAGGGALGRAVSPGMGPMMGGGAAGAGRGGGRGAGGRLGAGGKLGGGMAPGMGGVAGGGGAGAGRGGAGRGATGAGGRGAGARGAGGVAGTGGGAGYGEEDTARNTWLEEDEDVWGADGGGTSGILR